MSHIRPILLFIALLTPSVAPGFVLTSLDDPQKERAIGAVQSDPKILALRLEFDVLAHRMSFWKARDFSALFGPPIQPVQKDYALTCTQSRLVAMSGIGLLGDEESKAHTDVFSIGSGLRVDVHFQRDGVSPNYMYFYIRTGDDFIRLDRTEQLEARVTWERTALWKAIKHIDERWKTVVQWEVDKSEFDKLFTGRQAVDPREKLRAYEEWGEAQGLALVKNDGPWPSREWRRKETRVAHAYGNGTLTNFILFDADGRSAVDHMGGSRNYFIRWNRPDGSKTRFESWERDGERGQWRPVSWYWSSPGGRAERTEMDTNGDGIPDQVWETFSGEQFKQLKVEESWAIHPKLISEEMQVADQPDRRLPIRRILK